MKSVTKIAGITAAALIIGLAPLSSPTPKAEAQTRQFNRGNMMRQRNFNRFDRNDRFSFRNRSFNRNQDFLFRRGFQRHNFPVRIFPNRDFFNRHGLFNRFPLFQRTFPSLIAPRSFVLIDRDNFDNFIDIQNDLTGPFSVDRVFLTVNHDFFNQFTNDFSLDQNVTISVDTGNNIVSMNTLTGTISTGDVDINIQ